MALHIPLSWLQDFVDCSLGAQALAERLTVAGLEVEEVIRIGSTWHPDQVVVGELVAVEAHPNADRLSVVQVNTGDAKPVQVVTGAPNIRQWIAKPLPKEGLKGALALPGAKLIDGHSEQAGKTITLKKGKLRGEASNGMLCSEKELGLSDEHEGILLLPASAPTGVPLQNVLGDEVLVFDIKGGFAHLLSVLGVAREVAAITQQPLNMSRAEIQHKGPDNTSKKTAPTKKPTAKKPTAETSFVKVSIENPRLCSRYTALRITGVDATKASPFHIQQRLTRAGMRPINAVVDATNYVMLEYGQPLHAFDYALLQSQGDTQKQAKIPHIGIRTARAKETLITLDGAKRQLDKDMLLITNHGAPIGLAGVMGGINSEVNANTQDILLEAANFDFLNIRRTSHLLKLRSEAAERFGKQLSPAYCLQAAQRCAALITEWCGGRMRSEWVDAYPNPPQQPTITLPYQDLERLLGAPPPPAEVVRILRALDFDVSAQNASDAQQGSGAGAKAAAAESVWQVTPPSYRLDIHHLVDLAEEIARIYGYDHLPATQLQDALPPANHNPRLDCVETMRDQLCASGLNEIITYSLVAAQHQQHLYPNQTPSAAQLVTPFTLRNPLSAERSVLRTRLLPEALTTLARNLHQTASVRLFEVGRVFLPQPTKSNDPLPHEALRLCALACGKRDNLHWSNSQSPQAQTEQHWDFYDMKGVAETLLQGLGITEITWEAPTDQAYHPGRSARLMHPTGGMLGHVGEVHPNVSQAFGLGEACVCALELDADGLIALWQHLKPVQPISPHPPVHEDVAFVVDESVPASQVHQALLQAGAPLLQHAQLFDVYQHEQHLGKGKKSLAFALVYQSFTRTLTEKEAEKTRKAIVKRLKIDFSAQLRDG